MVIAGPFGCLLSEFPDPALLFTGVVLVNLVVDSRKSLATPRTEENSFLRNSSDAEHETSKLPTLIEMELVLIHSSCSGNGGECSKPSKIRQLQQANFLAAEPLPSLHLGHQALLHLDASA
jgi:hypothetical protein